MSGTLQIEGFRALMIDFDISKKDRRWWYQKAMAVEEIRQKAYKNKDITIKGNN